LHCHRHVVFVTIFFISLGASSDVSIDVGSGAASQLLREALHQVLRTPRAAQVSLRTRPEPLLPSLAKIDAENRIYFENVTFQFESKLIRLNAYNVRIQSVSTITPNLWPMSFSNEIIHLDFYVSFSKTTEFLRIFWMDNLEIETRVEGNFFNTHFCNFEAARVHAHSSHYWLVDSLLTLASKPLENNLEYLVCPMLNDYASSVESATIRSLSLSEIFPPAYQSYLNNSNALLYYRIRLVDIQPRHAHITAQLEWDLENMEETGFISNSSQLNIHWDSDERVAFMIDDSAVNELLDQITWDFQWMNEQIGVMSPVLPQSSRDFLSTLCTSCYFLLNVWAQGPPVIHATNGSITLEKRDRINLRVVNPEKNATSVFVSMTLFINAELRPIIDSGTIRTMVQLLDTNVVMEEGAFPPSWTSFVQDLVRGMILDVMWPEMKKQIEDLTYSHGFDLAASCGVDLSTAEILIGEGQFGATLSLVLSKLEPSRCIGDLKDALPNASNLFAQS
uniref:Fatty-acid and retinol-binding protein 1 n=1 Tax=Enterobius vermicularis TaxID=51028 RepID=A0A0N4V4W9_ENTVE